MASEMGTPEQWRKYYLDVIRNLKPGLNWLGVHLGQDDAELRAVTVGWDAWARSDDSRTTTCSRARSSGKR